MTTTDAYNTVNVEAKDVAVSSDTVVLPEALSELPSTTVEKAMRAKSSPENVMRLAVIGLISSIVISSVATTVLIALGFESSDGLLALGSASVGALATLLTTSKERYYS